MAAFATFSNIPTREPHANAAAEDHSMSVDRERSRVFAV